jgi:hypothetical protein
MLSSALFDAPTNTCTYVHFFAFHLRVDAVVVVVVSVQCRDAIHSCKPCRQKSLNHFVEKRNPPLPTLSFQIHPLASDIQVFAT